MQVEWDKPFTWHDFPITNYDVKFNISSDIENFISSSVLSPDTLSFSVTQFDLSSSPSCTYITFSVRANNDVGYSEPGIVQGAFPYGKFDSIYTDYMIDMYYLC